MRVTTVQRDARRQLAENNEAMEKLKQQLSSALCRRADDQAKVRVCPRGCVGVREIGAVAALCPLAAAAASHTDNLAPRWVLCLSPVATCQIAELEKQLATAISNEAAMRARCGGGPAPVPNSNAADVLRASAAVRRGAGVHRGSLMSQVPGPGRFQAGHHRARAENRGAAPGALSRLCGTWLAGRWRGARVAACDGSYGASRHGVPFIVACVRRACASRGWQVAYNPKGMEYAAQTQLTALTVPLGENLTLCRDHVREVIRQCLTEVQKMHIGTWWGGGSASLGLAALAVCCIMHTVLHAHLRPSPVGRVVVWADSRVVILVAQAPRSIRWQQAP